ncbi:MAG: 30S ribosomal protein S6 [Alphaproteobacteria bacterium]|nr:30S ribosomal protein S6 [Alphaproteobacteria bacterium]
MSLYESVFIVRQDVTAAQVDALADSFAKIVDDTGGTVQRREYWGLRSLSFRIKKNRKGHYVLFNLDAPPASIQEMERNMHINEDVLRYMTVRVEKLREEPSPIMQGKGDRERERADRTGRGGPRGGRGDRGDRPRFEDRDRGDDDGGRPRSDSTSEE